MLEVFELETHQIRLWRMTNVRNGSVAGCEERATALPCSVTWLRCLAWKSQEDSSGIYLALPIIWPRPSTAVYTTAISLSSSQPSFAAADRPSSGKRRMHAPQPQACPSVQSAVICPGSKRCRVAQQSRENFRDSGQTQLISARSAFGKLLAVDSR